MLRKLQHFLAVIVVLSGILVIVEPVTAMTNIIMWHRGTGSGTVKDGWNQTFPDGKAVIMSPGATETFVATADAGSVFTMWDTPWSNSANGFCSGTGNCTITGTGSATVIDSQIEVFAYFEKTYNITTSNNTTAGRISPTSATVTSGSTQAFTITPSYGYGIDTVTGCGGTLSGNTYTTGPITMDCMVSVGYSYIPYTITVNYAGTGSGTVKDSWSNANITNGSSVWIPYTSSDTFTATPNAGSTFTGWSGGSCSGTGTCTVTVSANTTITATFTANTPTTYTVTTSAGTGGSISPSSATVNSGNTTAFTITANTGYTTSSVTGCGGTLSGSTYTTGPITSNCTVSATFTANAPTTYTVTTSAGTGGTISPSGPVTVNSGATTAFTITPNSGYSISSVAGCSGHLSGNTYTTGTITSNCTVSASFMAAAPTTYTVTTSAGTGGTISPSGPVTVNSGATTAFTITPNTGYNIGSATGCGGSLNGTIYTTGAITSNCTVVASFSATGCTALNITSPELLPPGTVGKPYSYQLTTSGGQPPITFSAPSGFTVQQGLTITSAGLISGTPANEIISATIDFSASSACSSASKQFYLHVKANNNISSDSCTATLGLNGFVPRLDMPAIWNMKGGSEAHYYQADLDHVPTTDGNFWFKLADAKEVAFSSCEKQMLSLNDYSLMVPNLLINNVSYWAILQYVPGGSDIRFRLVSYGQTGSQSSSSQSIAGNWTLTKENSPVTYQWTILSNGTFTDNFGGSGSWTLNGDNITLTYSDTRGTVYTGTVNSAKNYMSGTVTLTTDPGKQGTWQASLN